jgi:pimeloyl-ACP methyl ester carboxylesterase
MRLQLVVLSFFSEGLATIVAIIAATSKLWRGRIEMKSRTIVFIHGMYMTPLCWEHWLEFFQDKGFTCLAPAWPGREQSVEVLRKNHPDPQLGRLTLSNVIEAISKTIKQLPEKPILIGHSMGGLVVQLLLQKDLAAAGVALDSAPPAGVFTVSWPFLKSNWPHINPFTAQDIPIQMNFERFQYTFANRLPLAEAQAAFERYVVPESRRVPRQSVTAKIDFTKPHPPLLLVAGSDDHLIPASLNKINFDRYLRNSLAPVSFNEFPGRAHFIVGQQGWQEVAGYTLSWLEGQGA